MASQEALHEYGVIEERGAAEARPFVDPGERLDTRL